MLAVKKIKHQFIFLFERFATALAVGFGLGFVRRAPGTWGSLLGLPLGACIYGLATHFFGDGPLVLAHLTAGGWAILFACFAVLTCLAWWAIRITEFAWQVHDDPRIVVDEIVGQALCVAMFAPSIVTYVIAFVMFRLLDIAKPGLVGWADRNLPGPWGVLVDDLIAGLITAMLMVGVYEIYTTIL